MFSELPDLFQENGNSPAQIRTGVRGLHHVFLFSKERVPGSSMIDRYTTGLGLSSRTRKSKNVINQFNMSD